MEHLGERGWITVREEAFGTRTRKRFRLSASGRKELERWLAAPVQPAAAAHTYDPLRTPVLFMDLVDSTKRRGYLENAERQTVSTLARHKAEMIEVRKDCLPWEILGREGAIAELKARLDWIGRCLETT